MAEPLATTLKGALDVIRHHHEKLDGSGYPDGLKGEDISMVARIMAIADIYDALVTDRPYHRGMANKKALAGLQRDAEKGLLDGNVVDHLVALLIREKEMATPTRPVKGTCTSPFVSPGKSGCGVECRGKKRNLRVGDGRTKK